MMIKISFILVLLYIDLFAIKSYQELKYVRDFYKIVAPIAVELGIKYQVPPAAIMAIAGVESGYGRGYVSRITGNILSLGAKKNEPELPALTLAVTKDNQILYSEDDILKYKKSDLQYKKRPKSLKKDYRPKPFAGTDKNLDYFDKHPDAKKIAIKENIKDFVKYWISKNNSFKPFRDAR